MATEIKVEVIERYLIKPSSPTPAHLRGYKLSVIDQFCQVSSIPVILFFACTNITIEERSQSLKKSLSQTLTKFYPFAGRLRDNLSIDCNDDGAELVLTRICYPVSKFLEKPDSKQMLELLTPSHVCAAEGSIFTSPLLLLQASFFDCGATSISINLSHKLGDASTICMFLNSWAMAASSPPGSADNWTAFSPQFVSSTLFPPHESLASALENYKEPVADENVRVKRLVFHRPAIEALRWKLGSPTIPNPTRVQAVLALIWKCLVAAASKSTQQPRRSIMMQSVNMRKMLVRNFPDNCAANMVWVCKAECPRANEAMPIQDLVVALRKAVEELKISCETMIELEGLSRSVEEFSRLGKGNEPTDIYSASSMCRFPLYQVDFGWGKPLLACVPQTNHKHFIIMIDSREGDGIDAWLSLSEEELALVEQNQDLLTYASFIRSAI